MRSGPIAAAQEHADDHVDERLDARPLGQALTALAERFQVQIVVYSADVEDLQSSPLDDELTLNAALATLLAPHDVTYQRVRPDLIVVGAPHRFGAQPPPPQQRRQDDSAPIADRLVVHAFKRETALQDTPAAISVFSGAELEATRSYALTDVSRLTPNFLGSSFTNTQPILAIRGGANTVSALGTSEPVGVYLDEIYLPRFSAADFELFDLESVEVLRGPQGTFFGRNVAAGAILLTTRAPTTGAATGRLQIETGSFDHFALSGLASAPVGEDAAVRLSLSHRERDGFGRDAISGGEQDDLEDFTSRLGLRWRPQHQWDVRATLDYAKRRNGARTLLPVGAPDSDPRLSSHGVDQSFVRELSGGSLNIGYESAIGQLTSITGYRQSASRERFSWVALSAPQLTSGFQQIDDDRERPKVFSQEFRFANNDQGPLSVIGGVYVLHETADRDVDRVRLAARSAALIRSVSFDQSTRNRAYAAYADATWRARDHWELSGGLRYSFETRDADLLYTDDLDPTRSFATETLSASFDAVTPRLALSFQPNDAITVYGSLARGFTAGGFHTEADRPEAIAAPFEAEFVWARELGVKALFADGRGFAAATAFHQTYDNKQEFVLKPDTMIGTVVNAADATMQGVEIEARFTPLEGVSLSASYGYLDTRFDRFDVDDGPGNTGNRLGSAPRHQVSTQLEAATPIASNRYEITGRLSYFWTDQYFTGATNDPNLAVDAYGLVDAAIGLANPASDWRVELFGTNLFDQRHVLIPSNFIVPSEHLGPPRLVGVRLSAGW